MIVVLIINIKTDEILFAALPIAHMSQKRFQTKYPRSPNLVPRAHVPFGQHQGTELWERDCTSPNYARASNSNLTTLTSNAG